MKQRHGHNPENAEAYGTAACIECGRTTPRRLPERFPHLCTECLFPQAPLGVVTVVGLGRMRAWEESRI